EKTSPMPRRNDELLTPSTVESVESRSTAAPPSSPEQSSIASTRLAAVFRPSMLSTSSTSLSRSPATHGSQFMTSIPSTTEPLGSPEMLFDQADEPLKQQSITASGPLSRGDERCPGPSVPFCDLVETEFGGLFYLINLGLF